MSFKPCLIYQAQSFVEIFSVNHQSKGTYTIETNREYRSEYLVVDNRAYAVLFQHPLGNMGVNIGLKCAAQYYVVILFFHDD